jgi:hypothetical protein
MRLLIPLVAVAVLLLGCAGGSSDGAPGPTADAREPTEAERLGNEIGDTYLLLLEDAKAMLALNVTPAQLRAGLDELQTDYRVRMANLACLRQALDEEEQLAVTRAADARIVAGGGHETPWLTQAATRYVSDPALVTLINALPTARLYAFPDQLARVRPGEQILCQ